MNVREYILANKPSPNTSCTVDCPVCGGRKKMGITNERGYILFHCYKECDRKSRGRIGFDRNYVDIKQALALRTTREFVLPDRIIRGIGNQKVKDYLIANNSLEAYDQHKYEIGYDPKLDRAVFLVKHGGRVVGAVGRTLSGDLMKAYTYPDSEVAPFVCGTGMVTVLVEDCASACAVARLNGFRGVALLGTVFKPEYHAYLEDSQAIIVALDNDATFKAIKMKRYLEMFYPNVEMWVLDKDLKDMNMAEIINKFIRIGG